MNADLSPRDVDNDVHDTVDSPSASVDSRDNSLIKQGIPRDSSRRDALIEDTECMTDGRRAMREAARLEAALIYGPRRRGVA